MAEPSDEDLRRSVVRFAWVLREDAGSAERVLDSNEPFIKLSVHEYAATARTCAREALDLQAKEAPDWLLAAAAHFEASVAHLAAHEAYVPLLHGNASEPWAKRTTELAAKEREYAARAMQIGRQAVHRALSRLVEQWPNSYEADPDIAP